MQPSPLLVHRSFDAAQHTEQRIVLLPGQTRKGFDHAVDLQQRLPALLFFRLRHERSVVVADLFQIGLMQDKGCTIAGTDRSQEEIARDNDTDPVTLLAVLSPLTEGGRY